MIAALLAAVGVAGGHYSNPGWMYMYLRQITLKQVKVIRELQLDLTRKGKPRMWTVLIGENGTCKTTILQAAAMAASGPSLAERLASAGSLDLRSLRTRDFRGEARITAEFSFSSRGHRGYLDHEGEPYPRSYPALEKAERSPKPPILFSQLWQMHGRQTLSGISWYNQRPNNVRNSQEDPLELLRGSDEVEPLWFVAGYGVNRALGAPGSFFPRKMGVQARLQSLFGDFPISGTLFPDHFHLTGNAELARAHEERLNEVLRNAGDLLPEVRKVDLGATLAPSSRKAHKDPILRHMATTRRGREEVEIPTSWLSQGYQSSLAWLSDLIGQILLEAGMDVPPDLMEGLVLLDELDLHLHPQWQVGIVQALKSSFPAIQFVVTTHSPLIVAGCEDDEVVCLEKDDKGFIRVGERQRPDPRSLTGSELYWNYFGLERSIPNPVGQALFDYERLKRNRDLRPDEQAELDRLEAFLRHNGKLQDKGNDTN